MTQMRFGRPLTIDDLPDATSQPIRGLSGFLQRFRWAAGGGDPRPSVRVRSRIGIEIHSTEGVVSDEVERSWDEHHFLSQPSYRAERFVVAEGRNIAVTRVAKAVAAPGLGFFDEFNVGGGAHVPRELLANDLQESGEDFVIDDAEVLRVPGLSVPFCHYGLTAFGHYVLDGLFQVYLFRRELDDGQAKLAHFWFDHPWMEAVLDEVGVPARSRRLLAGPVALLQRAGLSSTLAAHGVYSPNSLCREFAAWLAAKFASDVPSGGSRLFIPRDPGFGRAVRNADELQQLALDHGFEVFQPERHPIGEQVRRFVGADAVLSAWGSGLTLAPLLGGRRQVVELLPASVTDPWFFRQAVVHRFDYRPVLQAPVEDGGFDVDLASVDRALARLN
jgi:hypothetical protein